MKFKCDYNMRYLPFFIALGTFVMVCSNAANAFDLTVLHVNDIHARIEQTDKYLGYCTPKNEGEGILTLE